MMPGRSGLPKNDGNTAQGHATAVFDDERGEEGGGGELGREERGGGKRPLFLRNSLELSIQPSKKRRPLGSDDKWLDDLLMPNLPLPTEAQLPAKAATSQRNRHGHNFPFTYVYGWWL